MTPSALLKHSASTMNLKWLLVCAILLSTTAEPKKTHKTSRAGAAFVTVLRHIHRLMIFLKARMESMFFDAKPLVATIANDNPDFSDEIYSLMDTIYDTYNSDRFQYLQEDIRELFVVFIQPIITADDQCAQKVNDQVISVLTPGTSAFDESMKERFTRMKILLEETRGLMEIVMDIVMDITEDAIARGKECQVGRSTKLITCLYDAVMPWAQELDALSNEDPDVYDFQAKVSELISEVTSAGGNMSGVVEDVLKDVWMTFAMCVNSRYRHSSRQRPFLMIE